jgi:hypothetical protein
VSLGLNHLEDVVELVARRVLGSDDAREAEAVIDAYRLGAGHEAPAPPTADMTPPATKDQAIADGKAELKAAKARIAELEKAAAAEADDEADEAPAAPRRRK